MKGAAAEEGDDAVTTPPPPTCPVCMEPWTCSGDHRICCIPCGHVYGRSCLERWLHHSAKDNAKCPQCGEQFEDKLITNLYAPGNLWDGCCRLQELKAHYKSVIEEMEGDMLLKLDRLRAEMKEEIAKSHAEMKKEMKEEIAKSRAKMKEEIAKSHAEMKVEMKEKIAKSHAEMKEEIAKSHAEMKEEIAKSHAEMKESFRADWEQVLDEINMSWNEMMATANANMTLIKDQMKKMAEEEDARATTTGNRQNADGGPPSA